MSSAVPKAGISFMDVAHLVNLNPQANLQDALMIIVDRARVPNELFAKIIDSLHNLTLNFGHLHDQDNGEIRSRLMAPLFTHIVAEFNLVIKITLESTTDEYPNKRERCFHRYTSHGVIMMLVLELKYKLQSGQDRLDAVALLIAEAHSCDEINRENNVRVPFYVILCDGSSFQFLQFSASRLRLALLPFLQSRCVTMSHLAIPDLRTTTLSEFMGNVRKIVEVIFSLMLHGFTSAIVAYGGLDKSNITNCHRATMAKKALGFALDAGKLHDHGDHHGAEEMAQRVKQLIKNIPVPACFADQCQGLDEDYDIYTL